MHVFQSDRDLSFPNLSPEQVIWKVSQPPSVITFSLEFRLADSGGMEVLLADPASPNHLYFEDVMPARCLSNGPVPVDCLSLIELNPDDRGQLLQSIARELVTPMAVLEFGLADDESEVEILLRVGKWCTKTVTTRKVFEEFVRAK